MNIIISPVGTSLLTNKVDAQTRTLLNKHSNVSSEAEIPASELAILKHYFLRRAEEVQNLDKSSARSQSAELNGILSYYVNSRQTPADIHVLIGTDTWIGRLTCSWLESWLSAQALNVRIITPSGLQTSVNNELRIALGKLVMEIDTIFSSYKPLGAHIVFNLTGGFKSIQGFLQTLGVIYADETIYIFETADSLISIPKLPIRIVAEDYIRNNMTTWRRLASGLEVKPQNLKEIPETLYYELDGMYDLSAYGLLLWQNLRKSLYEEKIWESPSAKLIYGPSFMDSVVDLPANRRYTVNQQLDKLMIWLESGKKKSLGGLDPRKLALPHQGSTHEADAWADQDTRRFYFRENGDRIILDRLGHALH